jgi:RNA polymerase sigma-70 factor (ECF subfamily)
MGMTAEFTDAGDAKRNLVDALYRTYSEALRKFLGRQRLSPDEVADIVQETYCRVHEAGNVDTIRNPKAFLFQVAHNVWINRQKHPSKRIEQRALDVERIEIAGNEPGPYRSFESAQELAIVRAALEELPPRCRQAFVMNRFKEMTFSQIAVALNLSESMIEKHVSHALAHLKKRIKGRRLSHSHRALHLLK